MSTIIKNLGDLCGIFLVVVPNGQHLLPDFENFSSVRFCITVFPANQ